MLRIRAGKSNSMFFLVFLTLHAVDALPQVGVKPKVSATDPANGAAGVSRFKDCISVTFDTGMDTSYCGLFTGPNWQIPSVSCAWSADHKTMKSCRTDPTQHPLAYGDTISATLNPSGLPPLIKDVDGDFLDLYTLSFKIELPQGTGKFKIPADETRGFSWPYYLYVPIHVKSPGLLMVEPNNTGRVSDDPAVHDAAASSLIDARTSWAEDLGVPYLVPTFPRPASDSMYTHALDRKTILSTTPGLVRIDLQLMKMIEDARSRLAADGIVVDTKIFMAGASASGSFASRFILLHPEIVRAASIGSPGWGPAVPVGQFNGQTLAYPNGVADLQTLVGRSFDEASFRAIPLQVWVGDADTNVDSGWTFSDPTVELVYSAFGGRHLYQRWPRYEAAYSSVTTLAQFVVFPEMGHSWASWSYMKEFFERNRVSAQEPLPKPRYYKVYFPHVASDASWETEIALLNTIPGGASVHGQLQTYGKDGGNPLELIDLEIPPGGRKEITVGSYFQNPSSLAYVVFLSDSGFVAGYTRFNQPGNRVSLPAVAAPVTEGWFPKMETDGWTGLAFVNTSTADANVVLEAYDENGAQVAANDISAVKPGAKVIGLTSQLFAGADLRRARYFTFSSDREIIGFTVSQSDDGLKLDGLMALPRYMRLASEKVR